MLNDLQHDLRRKNRKHGFAERSKSSKTSSIPEDGKQQYSDGSPYNSSHKLESGDGLSLFDKIQLAESK